MEEIKVVGKSKVTKVRESAFQVNAIDTKGMANVTANLSQVLNKTTGVKVREQGVWDLILIFLSMVSRVVQ